jgi:hypothetical protein
MWYMVLPLSEEQYMYRRLFAILVVAATALGCMSAEDEDFAAIDETVQRPKAVDVDPLRELMLVDPSIVNDPQRTSNVANGHWSFRYLVEQMAPAGMDPAVFVETWLHDFRLPSLNGFALADRAGVNDLLAAWPHRADGKLDLAAAPFKLVAIVNRVDLGAAAGDLGEGRFVFALLDPATGARRPMTVIFEYKLPAIGPNDHARISRQGWAQLFHDVAWVKVHGRFERRPFGPELNAALESVTDRFAARNAAPGKINGNAIGQVRTNEITFGRPWELREFRLQPNGLLRAHTLAGTPDGSFNGSAALASLLNANREAVLADSLVIPAGMLAGEAFENFDATRWSAPGVDEKVRARFAVNTCNGCHSAETEQLAGFYHVSPFATGGADGSGVLSRFVTEVELPRRAGFVQHQLCGGLCDTTPSAEQPNPPRAEHARPSTRVH